MNLLEHTPSFNPDSAAAIAGEYFGVHATALPLPSERDQNFLLNDNAGEKFVLKIANAREERAFLEAENSVLKHLALRVSFCQQLVPASSLEEISTIQANGANHFARLVRYVPGVPMAEIKPHAPGLLRNLGRKMGQLARALADFDHPAVHRDFHWDLAQGNRILTEYGALIKDTALRDLVSKCRVDFEGNLRRSVIHGDANDHNLLVDPETMTVAGLIDFGDMVYSYTVADLAIAIAYVVLEQAEPLTAAREVLEGYKSEFLLLDDEVEALWPLVRLRLGMSACLAAYQAKQRPQNEYLQVSQLAIKANLERLLHTDLRR